MLASIHECKHWFENWVICKRWVIDDYIPLQLRAPDACQDAKYYIIRKDDHSLLELTFDQSDSKVKRITLPLS